MLPAYPYNMANELAGTKTANGGTIAYSGKGRQYVQYGVGDMGGSGQSQSASNTAGMTAANTPEAGPNKGIPAPVAPMGPPASPVPPPGQPVNSQQTGGASFAAATQNLGTVVGQDLTGTQAPTNKYQTGFQAAKSAGIAAPKEAGLGRSMVQSYLPQDQPDTSAIDSFIGQDKNVTSLMQGITQLLNPQQQTTTLLQDYQSLYKESGLDQINKEIIDADTVINGTETDIRNEIQGAGGFGTDSQVQAMSLARNKGLIKRYNQLVQMKTDATNQLNTLSQLNASDKQMAQQRLNTQIDGIFKLADFAQQAQNNIKEQARWLTTTVGADGLYAAYKNDPRQLSMLEQTLGLAPGGLAPIAAQAGKERSLDLQVKQANIAQSYAAIRASDSTAAKNYADIKATQDAKVNAIKSSADKADNTLTAVSTALKQVNSFSSGTIGGYSTLIPGSPSKNLESTIKTVQSALALDQLAALKANSPNGASGLGAASDREGDWLASNVANLDVGQSTAQLRTNLGLVKTHYINYLNGLGYDYDEKTGNVIAP